jgi:Tol biopolymer transport system component
LRASTYGPPGLYIINSKGVGIPRLLSPNPGRDLAFSPNGKSLALVRGGSIVIVDCLSGSERTVLFTDNLPNHPDWSPDGSRLVYSRNGLDPGEPEDSAGIHLLDLATGVTAPIKHDGRRLVGGYPQWSPADSVIAFVGVDGAYLVTPDGTRLLRLPLTPSARDLTNPQWINAGGSLLINDWTSGQRTLVVDTGSGAVGEWPIYVGEYRAIAPDDSAFAFARNGVPLDLQGALVLFSRHLDDASGVSVRQLTFYEAPAPNPAPTSTLTAGGPDERRAERTRPGASICGPSH